MNIRSVMCKGTLFMFWVTLLLLVTYGTSQQLRGHRTDPSPPMLWQEHLFLLNQLNATERGEIARQNRITQQILAQYLQRRLFPHLTTTTTPTPPAQLRLRDTQKDHHTHHHQAHEGDGDDRLETVESEQISNVYYTSEGDCANCVDEGVGLSGNRWTMPLLKLGEKRYYLGIFFKANWYRAAQYCRYHGMHLASINSQEENDKLEKHIRDFGLGHEHFWTSGTDQAEEGVFFWMSTGRPVTFTNWNTGEPNNFRYENGEEEHCLELWNRDGKGLKWNDTPCSFETFFVCEVP